MLKFVAETVKQRDLVNEESSLTILESKICWPEDVEELRSLEGLKSRVPPTDSSETLAKNISARLDSALA
jgi:hypothetical protein